jgi:hypothetical protein
VRRALTIVVPLLVVGIVGTVVAVAARESDASFVYRQEHASTITPLQVARAVEKAREPVPGGKGTVAVRTECTPGKRDARRNPWLCRVRYKSGRRVGYRITIAPNGAFRGVNPTGERLVSGCCITVGSR